MPAEEGAVRVAYDAGADLYADTFRTTEPEAPVDLAMIEHYAALVGGQRRVLDAGCGAGRMMPFLAARGCTVEGVDLSPGMVRRARTDHPEFPARVGSLSELPFPDGDFDGVFSWYSTIHSPDSDLARIFGEMKRVLRAGGLVLLAFQTGAGVREVGQGFRNRGVDVSLLRHHRGAATVSSLLSAAGFTVVAALDRGPVGAEADGQAVLIARV